MDHTNAILQDAGDKVDAAASSAAAPDSKPNEGDGGQGKDQRNERKRKWEHDDSRGRGARGGRDVKGGRGGGHDSFKRNKKGDMGRAEYFRDGPDKRKKTDETRQKRENDAGPRYGTEFSKEEVDAEERKPKRKVAVMIGYAGTGYKGMQITPAEKTIEGDLFNAFIAAGAISKANADDPKKASLVRCARTDKGVHAAGNMISLKLIIEDENIVAKINENLAPQIRVWGIERTTGGFSCYQACDSRWYEYLMPTHAFLPPHPSSWLAKKLEAIADEAGDREGYEKRQEEVKGFWEKVDEKEIMPILDTIDGDIRYDVVKALQGEDEAYAKDVKADAEGEDQNKSVKTGSTLKPEADEPAKEKTEEAAIIINEPELSTEGAGANDVAAVKDEAAEPRDQPKPTSDTQATEYKPQLDQLSEEERDRQIRLTAATKRLRRAYLEAKRRYRIPKQRIDRVQAALDKYVGTVNYHNYTIQKTFRDPSSKRHIKSFVVEPKPVLVGDESEGQQTEWLSLKVHGQSFMMHQIRKMVGMVTLLVRSGSDLSTMDRSFENEKYSIPKVPGLGLLLERPVFDTYNRIQAAKYEREKLDFGKYSEALEEFKHREIYQRIFREEQERSEFHKFFNHVDNFREPWFLWVSSKGLEATKWSGKDKSGQPEEAAAAGAVQAEGE